MLTRVPERRGAALGHFQTRSSERSAREPVGSFLRRRAKGHQIEPGTQSAKTAGGLLWSTTRCTAVSGAAPISSPSWPNTPMIELIRRLHGGPGWLKATARPSREARVRLHPHPAAGVRLGPRPCSPPKVHGGEDRSKESTTFAGTASTGVAASTVSRGTIRASCPLPLVPIAGSPVSA
jgi:hypothetical protein